MSQPHGQREICAHPRTRPPTHPPTTQFSAWATAMAGHRKKRLGKPRHPLDAPCAGTGSCSLLRTSPCPALPAHLQSSFRPARKLPIANPRKHPSSPPTSCWSVLRSCAATAPRAPRQGPQHESMNQTPPGLLRQAQLHCGLNRRHVPTSPHRHASTPLWPPSPCPLFLSTPSTAASFTRHGQAVLDPRVPARSGLTGATDRTRSGQIRPGQARPKHAMRCGTCTRLMIHIQIQIKRTRAWAWHRRS